MHTLKASAQTSIISFNIHVRMFAHVLMHILTC
jgi:hypothetical protein